MLRTQTHETLGGELGARDYHFRLQGKICKTAYKTSLDDAGGPWGGPVTSLNSRAEFYRPRMMQYRFENGRTSPPPEPNH